MAGVREGGGACRGVVREDAFLRGRQVYLSWADLLTGEFSGLAQALAQAYKWASEGGWAGFRVQRQFVKTTEAHSGRP